jgi:tellurite resistance protein
MLDWNKIKQKTSELCSDAAQKFRQYTPESFSKEKKFVNGVVISLALVTMADKKAETSEVTSCIDLINEIDEIKDLDMTTDAIALYELHIETLEKVVDNSTKWTIEVAKLLSEIGKLKPYPEYPPMIEALVNIISEADGDLDPLETQMKEKILGVIG